MWGWGGGDAVCRAQTSLIPDIAALIRPAVSAFPQDFEAAVKQNARNMRTRLAQTHPLAELIAQKKALVVAAYYDLNTGCVDFLEPV